MESWKGFGLMPSFRKVYVKVIASFEIDGKIIPMSITWEDGSVYEIDKVIEILPRASLKVGGTGLRYSCRISGHETYLFLEESRWFVEGKFYN